VTLLISAADYYINTFVLLQSGPQHWLFVRCPMLPS